MDDDDEDDEDDEDENENDDNDNDNDDTVPFIRFQPNLLHSPRDIQPQNQ